MKTYHYGNYRYFTFPAIDDAKKNDIFATSHTITLIDYPASKAEDRGWNLVGNPYPAYYDMTPGRRMTSSATIVLWLRSQGGR